MVGSGRHGRGHGAGGAGARLVRAARLEPRDHPLRARLQLPRRLQDGFLPLRRDRQHPPARRAPRLLRRAAAPRCLPLHRDHPRSRALHHYQPLPPRRRAWHAPDRHGQPGAGAGDRPAACRRRQRRLWRIAGAQRRRLRAAARDLSWADYGGYRIGERQLWLLDGAGSVWLALPLADVDNVALLLELLRERLPQVPAAETSTDAEHSDP